jgi:glycosyltransferase involved in cell wall biosynthesis
MRILIYTHAFPPMVGGIETITMQLAMGLSERSRLREPEPEVEITVVTPTAADGKNEDGSVFRVVRRPKFFQFARLVWKTDILHIAGPNMLPLMLGWLFRKRTVVEHHGFQTACPSGQLVYQPDRSPCPNYFMAGKHGACLRCNANNGPVRSVKQWLLTFLRRWLCSTVSANVMPTTWLGTIVKLPRMITIHHGLPEESNLKADLDINPPSIVFQGRLVSTKGIYTLLEAADQLRDCEFQLKIIGDGPERDKLEQEAGKLGLQHKIQFLGYLSGQELEQALLAARAVVMPSLGGEVFGLVALENMLRRKALVVSSIGALAEVVGDAGLTFPAGDAGALADCLRRVLRSHEFAENLGSLALKRARSLFTAERMVSNHLMLYQRLFSLGQAGQWAA